MTLNYLSLSEALKGIKEKKFSSPDIWRDCQKRIAEIEPQIHTFVSIVDEPQIGLPYAIKDNFCTKNWRTTASAKVLDNFIPPYNATVVEKLSQANCSFLGKTNMDAWAHGSSTETSDYGPTKNPWDLNRLPGGSSGGSAAAVAADLCLFAIGSETAGSIRIPASWCGITGLKPTYGRVSRYGLIAMASSFDCPGPMTKTVEDAALIYEIIAGHDVHDATSLSENIKPINLKSCPSLRIGLPKEYLGENIEKSVKTKILEAAKLLEKQGHHLQEISLFDPKFAIAVYTILQRAEVSSNLGRYDGIRYGRNRAFFGEEAKRRIMLGTYTLSAGYYDAYYLKAQKVRTAIMEDFKRAFQEVDVILGPTSPHTAPLIGSSFNNPMYGEIEDSLVEPSSIAGLPGLNIPVGFADNLPVGMQIIGPWLSEERLLELGHQFQQLTDFHLQRPKL